MTTRDDPGQYHRRSIRLPHYEYSQPGSYFVTLVSHGRACRLGEISGAEMALSAEGQIVRDCWFDTSAHFDLVGLDEFVVMPNHLHGIILISDSANSVGVGKPRLTPVAQTPPDADKPPPPKRPTLGQIVGYFKYQSTKQMNAVLGTPGAAVLQRNYYERVIRNAAELAAARQYIQNNPTQWALDTENPLKP